MTVVRELTDEGKTLIFSSTLKLLKISGRNFFPHDSSVAVFAPPTSLQTANASVLIGGGCEQTLAPKWFGQLIKMLC